MFSYHLQLLLLLLLSCLLQVARSQTEERLEHFRCLPAGTCEPCPTDHAEDPACRPFGKRRPLSCVSLHPLSPSSSSQHLSRSGNASDDASVLDDQLLGAHSGHSNNNKRDFFWNDHETSAKKAANIIHAIDWDALRTSEAVEQGVTHQGVKFHSWAPCVRVVSKERSDFGEFVLCNAVIAALALVVLTIRHRKLAMRQYVRLAARIGIPGVMV